MDVMSKCDAPKGSENTVAVIGAGLVGSLETLFLAKRGYDVHLYEFRGDIRKSTVSKGRSINLALSHRGRRALQHVGLEDKLVKEHGIPMRARMIHSLDGATTPIPYDSRTNQCIYSIGRKYLNEVLLTESEKYPNVQRHFNHKLIEADLDKGDLTFLNTESNSRTNVSADLIVGADGAFSALRRAFMRRPRFDFSQQYIEHGYLELCIPPSDDDNGFAMPPNYLHIWPRGTFMMIALPNQDYTWTVTLFAPFAKFQELQTPEELLKFFYKYFPDAVPLIGKEKLVKDFFAGTPSPLMAVKCRPYNAGDKALLIGDAAHAVVPFYGQGMNAGFEDCVLLDELMQHHEGDLPAALASFSDTRWTDAHAISDLAMYNYVEMRDLVNRRSYILRKKLDDLLFWLMPGLWMPLYNTVTFSHMPYARCIQNRAWQDKILTTMVYVLLFVGVLGILTIAYRSTLFEDTNRLMTEDEL